MTTAPIANRALSPISIGLDVFTSTAKSFDLAFKKTKINTNAKALAKGLADWPIRMTFLQDPSLKEYLTLTMMPNTKFLK